MGELTRVVLEGLMGPMVRKVLVLRVPKVRAVLVSLALAFVLVLSGARPVRVAAQQVTPELRRLQRAQQLAWAAYPELRTQGLQFRIEASDTASPRVTIAFAAHDRDDVVGLSRPREAQLVIAATFDGADGLTGATLGGPLTHAAERRRIRALAGGWTDALKAEGAQYAPDKPAALLRDLNLPSLAKVLGRVTATGASFQAGTAEDGLYWQVAATTASGAAVTLGFEPYKGRLVRVGGGAQ
jgi:hypothetical protein